MVNLTITVDGEVLRRARVKAGDERTSVSAVLRGALERYVDADCAPPAPWGEFRRLLDDAVTNPLTGGGRAWTRESIQRRPFAES